jgi:hypothetical protein
MGAKQHVQPPKSAMPQPAANLIVPGLDPLRLDAYGADGAGSS